MKYLYGFAFGVVDVEVEFIVIIYMFIRLVVCFGYIYGIRILNGSTPFLEKCVEFLDTHWLDIVWHVPTMETSASFTNLVIRHWLAAFVASRSCISRKDDLPTELAVVALLAYALKFALLSRCLL